MPIPPHILVTFDRTTQPIRCHSVSEMDAALDGLRWEKLARAGCRLAVSISIPGYEVYTGLGSTESFVMLGAEPFDNWYVALGDESAEGDDKMFYGVCDDCYWAPKHLIPVEVAREAGRYFLEHQQRSPTLRWEH